MASSPAARTERAGGARRGHAERAHTERSHPERGHAERVQKVLAQLGLASRREAENWIRAGRLTVNGKPAVLGTRVLPQDQLRLDGRLIRQRRALQSAPVLLCHRSPGERLLAARGPAAGAHAHAAATVPADAAAPTGVDTQTMSLAARLPRRAGLRFVSISPLPTVDGGLELLTADGAVAARLQRAMRAIEMEFSLRVRGELSAQQQAGIRSGVLDRGVVRILSLEPLGGEASNRWYRLVSIGASGNQLRQLIERAGATLVRLLRTRVGPLSLPRSLPRSHWRALTPEELAGLLDSPGSGR